MNDIPDYRSYISVEGPFENTYRDVSDDLLKFDGVTSGERNEL